MPPEPPRKAQDARSRSPACCEHAAGQSAAFPPTLAEIPQLPAPEGDHASGSSHEASLRRRGPAGEATDSRDLVPRPMQASRLSGFRSIMAAPRLLGLSAFIASGPHAGSGGGLGRR
jgi:hypothetical protein